jgi:hypothetical protein
VIKPPAARDTRGQQLCCYARRLFMNRTSKALFALIPIALVALTGAKGNGCGGEYQAGDGSSANWDVGTIPVAKGADQPMTCEWLDSNNCWKQMVSAASACAPKDVGTFNQDRSGCEFDQAATMEFAGPLSTPASGTTTVEVTDHRFTDATGAHCLTAKILGVGRGAYATTKGTIVVENKSITNYRVICADGSAFANDVPGTCADFGSRYLQKKVPAYLFSCTGGAGCASVAGGTTNGELRLVSCK